MKYPVVLGKVITILLKTTLNAGVLTMSKVTKKEFFDHMSELYHEKYNDQNAYRVLLNIIERANDKSFLEELYDIIMMTKSQRLIYRNQLACNGKEFTPRQVDQYISLIEYALEHLD